MSVEFKFDKDAFDRAIREHIEKGVADTGDALQAALDKVHAEYPGNASLDRVRPALVSALAEEGMELTEPELSKYAEKLAAGYRIIIRTEIVGSA
jgi:hypothetical protein